MATVSMNEVESLKDTFRVRKRRENNQDMEDLMTGTDDIKLLSTPSLRDLDISQPASTTFFLQANLQSISWGTQGVQNQCCENPIYTHLLILYLPSVVIYSVDNWDHGE